jgi:5-methylcytosine-specific restriction protein B
MQFEWIDFYMELADKLLAFKNNRKGLIEKIVAIYSKLNMKMPTLESGDEILDIDPFTVFGLFNKGITDANRIAIMGGIAKEFNIKSKVPSSFDGVPFLHVLQATFYGFEDKRKDSDIDNIWELFSSAIALADSDTEENRTTFSKWYNLVHEQRCIRWNITMGLYWIRPNSFVNLDSRNRWYITIPENMPFDFVNSVKNKLNKVPNATDYLFINDACKTALRNGNYKYKTFPELSYYAWKISEQVNQKKKNTDIEKVSQAAVLRWFTPLIQALKDLGGSAVPSDVYAKIAENEKLTEEEINETRDKSNNNKFKNNVAWVRQYLVWSGYIDDSVRGVWTLTKLGKNVEMTSELASEIYKRHVGKNQKKDKTENSDLKDIELSEKYGDETTQSHENYTKEDFLNEVFVTEEKYNRLASALKLKKNIILQGAPGVGKTFVAKRLAYSIMGEKDDSRIEFVQFHQNYSYEDFVMGYKPAGNSFELKYGIFYRFCKKTEDNPDKKYFFIIDEINRGNMSKIFGELLMLIEEGYRGTEMTLAYDGSSFSVPKNLYIIGMMNTADRNLAMIDYALRRRFSFIDMEPEFDSEGFKEYQNQLNNGTFNDLISKVKELNKYITKDKSLGKDFCIGHSYFCGADETKCTDEWMLNVVDYDIIPMIREYWFDDTSKVEDWENKLHEVFQ